jgi:hypothetical protein
MKISYFVKPGRTILMARVYVDGKPKDKSTGISVSGLEFDYKLRRFKNKSDEAMRLNMTLNEFEQSVYKTILSGNRLESVRSNNNQELTLSSLLDIYEKQLRSGKILSRTNGKPLSEDTVKTFMQDVRFLRGYLEKNSDVNFSQNNATTPGAKRYYNNFIVSLKSYMANLDGNTSASYLGRFKTMIVYTCKMYDIEMGSLLDEMNQGKINKPVIILDQEQMEFVLNNYEMMVEDCTTHEQKVIMEYWLAAVILNARKRDMTLWTEDNLYVNNGDMWIRYVPHKNKSYTHMIINVPVYDKRLANIFTVNIKKYKGRLLPPLSSNNSVTKIMKRIASRYEIFRKEIQLVRNGEVTKKRMCDYIKMHQMRASGASDKVMRGMPVEIVKKFTGHTANSAAWARYLEVFPTATEKYVKILQGEDNDSPPQTTTTSDSLHTS